VKALQRQIEFILGATKTGLDIIDTNFNLRYIDPEWAKIYGDPTGRKCYEYFMGRSAPCPGCGIPKALETKSRIVTEEILAKEGNRPIQVITIPFQDEKGEWLLAEVNVDITERKRAEEKREQTLRWEQGIAALQQSLLAPAPLGDKLRSISDGIVRLFDADFCCIWLIRPGDLCERGCIHAEVKEGPHVCRHRDRCLHLLASSGRYTHIDDKVHRRVPFGCYKIGRGASDEDRKFLTNDVQTDPRVHDHEWARELGLVSFAGYQLRVPGGDKFGVLALFTKHLISDDEDAMLDGLSSTVARVVQHAAAEEEIRRLNEDLEQRVKDRTTELAAANKELEAFAYAVSHDLRAPLVRIDGFSKILLRKYAETLDVQGKDYLERVSASTQRMAELINDLLAFSRTMRHVMKPQSVDLSALAGAIASELRKTAPRRKVEFKIAPGLAANGDPHLLQVVLENLLGNAWKFTGKKEEARIEFGQTHGAGVGPPAPTEAGAGAAEPAANDKPVFFVRDNGAGFNMAYVHKLFGPFQRLHAAKDFEGTGVGLSTVQRIIHRHGGRIWAEGAVEQGATFYFAL
jgi:signal transduction histidine kinase